MNHSVFNPYQPSLSPRSKWNPLTGSPAAATMGRAGPVPTAKPPKASVLTPLPADTGHAFPARQTGPVQADVRPRPTDPLWRWGEPVRRLGGPNGVRILTAGEVSEWFKVPLSKSGVVNSHRGFESRPLRQKIGYRITSFRPTGMPRQSRLRGQQMASSRHSPAGRGRTSSTPGAFEEASTCGTRRPP